MLKEVEKVNHGWKITGNGLFLFGMARRIIDTNFLGLELNAKVFYPLSEHIHSKILIYKLTNSGLWIYFS